MSFRRYVATTVREGLDRVRRELGDDAVILSNKRLGPGRIEIVAAASDSMQALVEEVDRPNGAPRQSVAMRERTRADELAQTESFQDFIRRQAPPSALRATGGQPASAPRPTSAPRATVRQAASAQPASSARASAGSPSVARSAEEGVAMYHEVAQVNLEADTPSADTFEPASPAQPSPAVFRQRTARDAEMASGATIAGLAAPGSINGAPARLAAPAAINASAARPGAPASTNGAPARLAAPAAMAGSAIRPTAPQAPPEQAPEPTVPLQPAPAPKPLPALARPQAAPLPDVERDDTRVMAELRSLRAALSDRIAALESNIALSRPAAAIEAGTQRNPAATRVMTRMLMSGFSPDLARRVAVHVPATSDIAAMDAWLHEVVAGNLRCAEGTDGLLESQGAVALVGPTGVGKTTTVAKLAARFAVRYGATQLGLVTLDSYRIGAHEQLRSYGRILGVPMHIAQDGATLRELLASLQGKRLVLIDTCGLSQRDERMEEMLGTLSAARFNMQPIRRVLLLNAASHSETLDEVARAWHAADAAGAILTKMDEAARIGGPLDCLLRYRMTLFGLTNGQRVPEDWHPASARLIAHVALKPSTSPFSLGDEEAQAWSEQPQGRLHA
jgi:flagellar biosynthesis protein FlhF